MIIFLMHSVGLNLRFSLTSGIFPKHNLRTPIVRASVQYENPMVLSLKDTSPTIVLNWALNDKSAMDVFDAANSSM